VISSSVQCQSIISVDVEEHFHVEAFSQVIRREEWDRYPSRVEMNTHRLLDLFDETGVKATFFFLGWVAERRPELVRQVARRGHELACHSFWHRLVYTLSPSEFRQDTARAKNCIEQAAGQRIFGYRAPSFSITKRCPWALDVLTELGFKYDSSIFPVKHDFYGIPDAPRKPFPITTCSGQIIEYPMATFRLSRAPNLPVGGGGYLRMLPYWYTQMGVRRAWNEGITVVTYIHPWELDPEQPRLTAPMKSRVRHYTNLRKTKKRLTHLLASGTFIPFRDSTVAVEPCAWHFPPQSQSATTVTPNGLGFELT
jgi:polysaccharide deacetylase family protein (PEP-CTERM system associated)